MNSCDYEQLTQFVNENISTFHNRRIATLEKLSLDKVLLKKNPYLFRAKNLVKASDLIESLMQAFLSSSEEPMFGEFLEDLAIFICSKTYGGNKSGIPGLDLEFINDNIRYLVSIKSGLNWGNSSQHKKLEQDFNNAIRVIKQNKKVGQLQPVLGVCYGKRNSRFVKNYQLIVGRNFWYLISGNENLYTDIIEPIGYKAEEKNQVYLESRANLENRLTNEFFQKFCLASGEIDWVKLVKFNSENRVFD